MAFLLGQDAQLALKLEKHELPVYIMGWVYKRGRSWRVRQLRYFRLHKGILSNHFDEYTEATWSISLSDCTVSVDGDHGNIDIATGGPSIRIHPMNSIDFQSWARALIAASAPAKLPDSTGVSSPGQPGSRRISGLSYVLNTKKLFP